MRRSFLQLVLQWLDDWHVLCLVGNRKVKRKEEEEEEEGVESPVGLAIIDEITHTDTQTATSSATVLAQSVAATTDDSSEITIATTITVTSDLFVIRTPTHSISHFLLFEFGYSIDLIKFVFKKIEFKFPERLFCQK